MIPNQVNIEQADEPPDSPHDPEPQPAQLQERPVRPQAPAPENMEVLVDVPDHWDDSEDASDGSISEDEESDVGELLMSFVMPGFVPAQAMIRWLPALGVHGGLVELGIVAPHQAGEEFRPQQLRVMIIGNQVIPVQRPTPGIMPTMDPELPIHPALYEDLMNDLRGIPMPHHEFLSRCSHFHISFWVAPDNRDFRCIACVGQARHSWRFKNVHKVSLTVNSQTTICPGCGSCPDVQVATACHHCSWVGLLNSDAINRGTTFKSLTII